MGREGQCPLGDPATREAGLHVSAPTVRGQQGDVLPEARARGTVRGLGPGPGSVRDRVDG